MKMRIIVSFIFSSYIVTGCAVIKNNPNDQPTSLEKSDYGKLSGRFSNYPSYATGELIHDMTATVFAPESFWSHITGYYQQGEEDSLARQTVIVNFVSENKATAQLWEDNKLLKTKKIRGKIKNGYFYRRPYFAAAPLVPLFFGYKTFRYRIGLTGESIVVDYKWNNWVFLVAVGDASKGQSKSVFSRR